MTECRRVSGCLSRREAVDRWDRLAATLTNLGRTPAETVGLRKWGKGWAVYLYVGTAGNGDPASDVVTSRIPQSL